MSRTVFAAFCLALLCVSSAIAEAPRKPAVNIFRVTFESETYGGVGYGRADIVGMERERGVVWFQNESDADLTDVKLIVHFTDQRYYRSAGSQVYRIGKMSGHQTLSVNYRWDNVADEKVYPWVEVTYKLADGTPQKSTSYPYGY